MRASSAAAHIRKCQRGCALLRNYVVVRASSLQISSVPAIIYAGKMPAPQLLSSLCKHSDEVRSDTRNDSFGSSGDTIRNSVLLCLLVLVSVFAGTGPAEFPAG